MKKLTKFLSLVLAGAMVLGSMVFTTAAEDEATTDAEVNHAYIGFQTPSYSFRNAWDDESYGLNGANSEADGIDYFNQVTGWDADGNAITLPGTFEDAVIDGNGTYTVKATGLEFADTDFATQEYMNLIFVSTDLAAGDAYSFSDVSLKINGSAVDLAAVDGGFLDNPDEGDYHQIMIQNIWNKDGIAEIGYYAVPVTYIEITFTVSGFDHDSATAASSDSTGSDDSSSSDVYHAYIGFQTPSYSFRNAWDDASYGINGSNSEADGVDYFNQVTGWDADNKAYALPGTFEDVEITGNGTYTVKATGLEFADTDFATQEYMNLIFVSTDLPASDEGISFSDVSLKINGSAVDLAAVDGGFLDNPDEGTYHQIMIQNIWNKDGIAEIGYYAVPVTDIEITFTVNGLATDAVQETEAAVEEFTTDENYVKPTSAWKPATTAAAEASSGLPTGAIVGIVVAVVVVIVLVVVVAVKKKK